MENKIIKKIMGSLRQKSAIEEYPAFSDKRYKPFKLSKDNFHEIKHTGSESKIAFIDGGNAEIMGSANFSLHLIRIYFTIYHHNKRIKSERKEFYALASAFGKDDEIFYKAEIFPETAVDVNEGLVFNSYDSTIKEGSHRIKISKIGEIARMFAELKAAAELASKLESGDIIVRDGSLQSSVTNESKYFSELYKQAAEKNILIAGLSKTSTLLTDAGNSLSTAINRLSPKGSWYYHPIAEINNPGHEVDMFFVKLNGNSNHVFRFEAYKKQKYDINEVLSLISANSNDPSFRGYPYGLIEADKFAKVSENEAKTQKLKFTVRAGREWKAISEEENAVNAHDLIS